MPDKIIRIGGGGGYWGEGADASSQLLKSGVNYLVYDLLAELVLPQMARMRKANPDLGYALDFADSILKPNLNEIAHQKVKVLANAGGLNPQACGESVRRVISELGLNLKVAVVSGDDVLSRAEEFAKRGETEMYSGAPFPRRDKILGINAYLGAFPMAKALDMGADIVISGRVVDSSVTLAACIHEFKWKPSDLDRLAGGSLAGHILECGTQATGGNFTDWELIAPSFDRMGYPIAEVSPDGSFIATKPEGTGGMVSVGTVSEQMIYEIGDPQAYMLPDVVCDFSALSITQAGENRVAVKNAKGVVTPDSYKTCLSYDDGFRGGLVLTFYGPRSEKKAQTYPPMVLKSASNRFRSRNLPDFYETSIEIMGTESHYGAARRSPAVREVDVKIAVAHETEEGAGALVREFTTMALSSPPGLCAFVPGTLQPTPISRIYSFLLKKAEIDISIEMDGKTISFKDVPGTPFSPEMLKRPAPLAKPALDESVAIPLEALAFGRSGDKGDKSNVGIVARKPEYLPYICAALTEDVVSDYFAHFVKGKVERFLMPGPHAVNFLMHEALGGGCGGSLRQDYAGKGYAQLLLDYDIPIPRAVAERHGLVPSAVARPCMDQLG